MRGTIESGRGYATLLIAAPELTVGDGVVVRCSVPVVPVAVEWYYEPPIAATEDEPACPEYLELDSIHFTCPTHFTNSHGVSLAIMPEANLGVLLSDGQYEELLTKFKEQRDGEA